MGISSLKYPATLQSNNPDAFSIVLAEEVGGHRSVATLSDLFAIPDAILSASTTNAANDAIGQLWYVFSEGKHYQLVDWDNRSNEAGWRPFQTGIRTYDFRLSHSFIHVDGYGNLNTDKLSIMVGETSSTGYTIIDTDEELTKRNFKIQYSINGRVPIDESEKDSAIGLEDGSGLLFTEDGVKFALESVSGRNNVTLLRGGTFMLETSEGCIYTEDGLTFMLEEEGAIIPVDISCRLITLYLVDTANKVDRVVLDVPVLRDGVIEQRR